MLSRARASLSLSLSLSLSPFCCMVRGGALVVFVLSFARSGAGRMRRLPPVKKSREVEVLISHFLSQHARSLRRRRSLPRLSNAPPLTAAAPHGPPCRPAAVHRGLAAARWLVSCKRSSVRKRKREERVRPEHSTPPFLNLLSPLLSLKGSTVVVELRDDGIVRGILSHADEALNLSLTDATWTPLQV